MDVESLAKQLILKNMTPEQQTAVLDSIRASVLQAKDVQKQRIGENVQVVVQALKKLEADIRARYDETGKAIEKRVASIKDGRDGRNGVDGKAGKDGRPGRDGATGPKGADGQDGRNGTDGENGVSVTDAHIDFDGSLVISLSSGRTINVGEVVAPDLAEKIKVITNGGGTSQTVIDALASLQTQIDNLIPDQTGNAGKVLTTNGTDLSWASVGGGLSYQGTWNASTNTPTLTSGSGGSGYYYIVATAGSTNLDGITDWQIGDWLLFNGTVWQKIDQSNLVTSVNGQTGAVSLSTTDISEGTNLYYTDARARGSVSAGTGISYSSATGVITNAAPDQTVALTAGTGISTTGTYPNFTIANTAPDQTVVLTAGTGISTTGTYPNFTVTNTAPDQTVALTQGGTTTITGTYPNFTISSADQYAGTVTSVSGTGTVNGISLSGTVTSSGSLTLGGTLSNVSLSTQVTGTLPIANGGTGQTTRQAAMDALAGATTSGQYLRGDGTDVVMAAIVAADVPTLNQNTTGSAATLTTGRTIAITGDLAYTSPSFNGSANVTAAGTLATVNANVGSFTSANITVDAKGRVTAAANGSSSGTVTSVAATVPAFLSISGSPITTSGTLAIGYSGTALPVANGGTGVTTSTGSGAVVLGTSPTLTTPTINSAQVDTVSGTAPLYLCRAWVNFNGTGTVAIRASGNVSSITDSGSGRYGVNFTTAMPDANYVAVGIPSQASDSGSTVNISLAESTARTRTTSLFPIVSRTSDGTTTDSIIVSVSIFR